MGFEIEITIRELIEIATATTLMLIVLGLVFLVNDSGYINTFFEGKEQSLITSIITENTKVYANNDIDLSVYSKNPHYLESSKYQIYFYSFNKVVKNNENGQDYFQIDS